MSLTIIILDGYIDEPTCLGVPPYISPYPRYIAGAIWSIDPEITIYYITIDQIRKNQFSIRYLSSADIIIAIAGVSVPGKYFSANPMSLKETKQLFSQIKQPFTILSGPAAQYGYGLHGGKRPDTRFPIDALFNVIITGDSEIYIHHLLKNNLSTDGLDPSITRSNAHQINEFATKGAHIVTQHPYHPHRLITEIETYRGCARSIVGGCSFCSEPQKGPPDFRPINDIIKEIQALYHYHIRHIRLGNQPCLFSYQSKDAHQKEFPTPNPDAIKQLFKHIRTIAPDLQTLHIDNANPGVIAHHPEESKEIAQIIINHHTAGDVAAFGVESLDPKVIEQNNLKADQNDVLSAIKLLNDVGAKRGENGLPELLPGLNFLYGLIGERKQTYDINFDFLKLLLEKKLLIRRINIRQVIPIPHTELARSSSTHLLKKHRKQFIAFKEKVSHEINRPLLKRMIPTGTILKRVIIEKKSGKLHFGRQLGSYPLLIGVIANIPLIQSIDVTVVDHGFRSVTAVPYPLPINTATLHTLQALPGIGKKRAMRIIRNRPYQTKKELIHCFDDPEIGKQLIETITFTF